MRVKLLIAQMVLLVMAIHVITDPRMGFPGLGGVLTAGFVWLNYWVNRMEP